jgi:hypothetical protein
MSDGHERSGVAALRTPLSTAASPLQIALDRPRDPPSVVPVRRQQTAAIRAQAAMASMMPPPIDALRALFDRAPRANWSACLPAAIRHRRPGR